MQSSEAPRLMELKDNAETTTVLVVDDELDTRDGCQMILSRLGFPVFTAASGEQALQYSRSSRSPSCCWI